MNPPPLQPHIHHSAFFDGYRPDFRGFAKTPTASFAYRPCRFTRGVPSGQALYVVGKVPGSEYTFVDCEMRYSPEGTVTGKSRPEDALQGCRRS